MDLIINYPEFDKDIKNCFKDLIDGFSLQFIELHEGTYLLRGEYCTIRLTYDRGDTFCDFKLPGEEAESPGYNVWQVYRFFYPEKSTVQYRERLYDAKLQLEEHARMIKENLKGVLNGGFSWLPSFINYQEREERIFSLARSLDYNHPIRGKLRSGDLTWRDDIETYMAENHISI
jgi:hypothetical protein